MYKANDYSHLFDIPEFSRQLLENHFTLYRGYVDQSNKLVEQLSKMEKDAKNPQFAELKRRFGWEFNGMRLHEYYFSNLGGKSSLKSSPFQKAIDKHFGSFSNWQKDFEATGGMRGIGWAVLYYDPRVESLMNVWINEHDVSHLSGCSPILILDVFEHAFMLDFGLKKDEYIAAFMKNVRWEAAAERFEIASQVSVATTLA